MRRGPAPVSDRGLIGRAPPVTICQQLTPTPGSLSVIRLGVIGGPSDADTHSLENPVGQVAGATCIRTPPLACPPEPGGARALPALRLAQVGTATRERKCRRRNCIHVCAGASWVPHDFVQNCALRVSQTKRRGLGLSGVVRRKTGWRITARQRPAPGSTAHAAGARYRRGSARRGTCARPRSTATRPLAVVAQSLRGLPG